MWMYLPNLKFIALPVPEITGVLKILGTPWIRPRSLFSQIFNGLLFRSILWMCVQDLALPIPEIIWGTQKLGQSLDTPTLPFLRNFYGLFLGWTMWMYLPNLKFVALPISEKIGGTQKNLCSPWIYAHAPFSPKLFMGFCSTVNVGDKFAVRSCSWDNSDCSFRLDPHSWGREGRKGSGMVPFERALVSSYRRSIVTFHLSLRVSEILPLLCFSTPLFHTPPA